MPYEIEVGDKVIEFPDDVPFEEAQAALAKQFPPTGEDIAKAHYDPSFVASPEQYKIYEDYQKNQYEADWGETIGNVVSHLGGVVGGALKGLVTTNPVTSAASGVEGFAQGTRGMYEMVAESSNPDALAFRIKDFLFNDGSFEERYQQYVQARDFGNRSARLMAGDDSIVIPQEYLNNDVVQGFAATTDVSMLIPFGMAAKIPALAKAGAAANRFAQKATQAGLRATGKALRVPSNAVLGTARAAGRGIEAATGVAPETMRGVAYAAVPTSIATGVGAPVAATLATAKAGDIVGQTLIGLGNQIGHTPSRVGALARMAVDETLPVGVRNFAKVAAYAGGDTAIDFGMKGAAGMSTGAIVGGLMGYYYDSERGAVGGVAAGTLMGAAGAGLGRSFEYATGRVRREKQMGDFDRYVNSIEDGIFAERFKQTGLKMEGMAEGGAVLLADVDVALRSVGGELRIIDAAESQQLFGGDVQGAYMPERNGMSVRTEDGRPVVYLNIDSMSKSTAPHELFHALINTVAGGEQLNTARDLLFGSDAQAAQIDAAKLKAFAIQYGSNLTNQKARRDWMTAIAGAFGDGSTQSRKLHYRNKIAEEFMAYYGGFSVFSKGVFGKMRYNNGLVAGMKDTAVGSIIKGARRMFENRVRNGVEFEVGMRVEDGFAKFKNRHLDEFAKEVLTNTQKERSFDGDARRVQRHKVHGATPAQLKNLDDMNMGSLIVKDGNGKPLRPMTPKEVEARDKAVLESLKRELESAGVDPEALFQTNNEGTRDVDLSSILKTLTADQQAKLKAMLTKHLNPIQADMLRTIIDHLGNNLRTELDLTYFKATTDRSGKKRYTSVAQSEPTVLPYKLYVTEAGAITIKALDTNVLSKRLKRVFNESGKELFNSVKDAEAHLMAYLDNLTSDNPVPTTELEHNGVKFGAEKRNFMYEVVGTVPSLGAREGVVPNAPPIDRKPRAGYVPSHKDKVFKDYRIDRMSNMRETGRKMSFTEDKTYFRSQANFMVKEPANKRGVMRYSSIDEDSRFMVGAGNPVSQRVAKDYVSRAGIPYRPHATYLSAPVENLKAIADWHQNAKHEPASQDVQESYGALSREVMAQYDEMVRNGLKAEPWEQDGEPYANSLEMMDDVQQNNHMWFFRTENGFGEVEGIAGDHPMLAMTGVSLNGRELLLNDVFRIVHDYFGHTQNGFQFGPRGEYNAYKEHAAMFSEAAQGALAAETLAQNAWVNYGSHIRRKDGTIPKNGDSDFVPPMERPFAEQKATVVPKDMRFMVADKSGEVSDILAEVNYGSGAVLPKAFPKFSQLDADAQRNITTQVLDQSVGELAKIIGSPISLVEVNPTTGVWGGERSPSVAISVRGKDSAVDQLALALGIASEQAMTMSIRMGDERSLSNAILFKKSDGTLFDENDVTLLIEDAGISGMTLQLIDGNETALIVDSTPDYKPIGFTKKRTQERLNDLSEFSNKTGIVLDIESLPSKVKSYENNWQNNLDGQEYLQALERKGSTGKIRRLADYRSRYTQILAEAIQRETGRTPAEAQRLTDYQRRVNRGGPVGSFMVSNKRSYLDLVDSALDNPSKDNFVDTDPYEGGKVRSIAKMFADTMAGVRKLRPSESGFGKAGDRIVDLLDRAIYEFPNFASWYEGKIKEAMDVFTELDPDLAKPENKSALTLLLAVTSNGAKVFEQTVDAWAIYKHFKQAGNVSGFSGGRGSSRAEAVSTHLRMIDKFSRLLGGMDKVGEFMSRKGTVKELREALVQDLGYTRKEATNLTGGELIDEVVPFSLVFGAKLGSFFNNLNGDFTTVTMDRWFMRTFGRAMGTQLDKAVDARKRALTRFNDALENYEGSLLKRAGTRKSDSIKVKNYRLWKFFTDAENRKNLTATENDIRRAANALIKVGDGFTLREAPKNGSERRWIRNVMLDAIDKFNSKTGKNLNPAEAQALLWYYEKLIHETFGSRQDDSSPDYAAAARRVYAKERGREASTPSAENSSGIERRRDGRRGETFGGDTAQPYQGRGGKEPSSPLKPNGGESRFMPSDVDNLRQRNVARPVEAPVGLSLYGTQAGRIDRRSTTPPRLDLFRN